MDNQSAFVRGLSGHDPFRTLRALPARFGMMFRLPSDAVAVATASERLHVPVDSLDPNTVLRLLASDDLDDQVAGTRLLSTPGIPLPTDLFMGLRPQAFPSLVTSLASRTDVPTETWLTLLGLVTDRVRANPRAWGAPWVSLRDGIPLADPAIQNAIRTSVRSLASVTGLPPAVLSVLRCGDARVLDRVEHSLTHTLQCGTGTDHWRSLATAAEVIASQALPPAESTRALLQLVHDAGDDARVLEALAPAAVVLPPASARPIVEALAMSRDPGVLAALLEQLALHVQHARALPPGVRTAVLSAPFGLREAESVEARTHAIEIARALRLRVPASSPQSRALQQAMSPDGGITPARQFIPTETLRGTLTLVTDHGSVVIALREDTAREATDTVVRAALGGRYNGTVFHRVVPGFVVQGGDPRADGYGGTDGIVPTELCGEHFSRGTVGIALAGLDTGGMQFFMVTADAPGLDGRYPYLGRVIAGMDVVDGLMVGDTIERAEYLPRVGAQ